jgi:predicted membrane-bound mannosyltransferase
MMNPALDAIGGSSAKDIAMLLTAAVLAVVALFSLIRFFELAWKEIFGKGRGE